VKGRLGVIPIIDGNYIDNRSAIGNKWTTVLGNSKARIMELLIDEICEGWYSGDRLKKRIKNLEGGALFERILERYEPFAEDQGRETIGDLRKTCIRSLLWNKRNQIQR